MKKPSPRQHEIFNLLKRNQHLRAHDLQTAFNISKATAYREMEALTQLGLAQKIPGGIASLENVHADGCIQCGRMIHAGLAFTLQTTDGYQLKTCCPHCGLMALETRPTAGAITTDFFYGTIVNANQAWYVLESMVAPCCNPPVLSFASRDIASRFAQAFNGTLADFSQARQHNHRLMHACGENYQPTCSER
jgi:DeoR family transcriptional regulator, copper-sensing transcriptional repressor